MGKNVTTGTRKADPSEMEATPVGSSEDRINDLLDRVALLESRSFAANEKLDIIEKWGKWAGEQVKYGFGQAKVGAVLEQLTEKLQD